ncbi:MAG: hypothetical protein HY318_12330 [Armatimonadetes bacterium]|nr:hypothetical protein [Armatimonadota bacterium]
MKRYDQHNFWYKLAALAIATLVWSHVRGTQNPIETKKLEVPIVLLNLPAGLEIVEGVTSEIVRCSLRGPRIEIQDVDPSDIRAQVDLAGVPAGTNNLKISYVLPSKLNHRSIRLEPSEVTIALEEIAFRDFDVLVTVLGETPSGFTLGIPITTPPRVKVAGRASLLSKVRVVFAKVPGASLMAPFHQKVKVNPVDRSGVYVSGLGVTPEEVEVRLDVKQTEATKPVKVVPQIIGRPAAGYEIEEITSDPDLVMISGEPQRVGTVKSIKTEKIDIAATTATTSRHVALRPPDGIKVAETETRVTVALRRLPVGGVSPESPRPEREGSH